MAAILIGADRYFERGSFDRLSRPKSGDIVTAILELTAIPTEHP